MQETLNPLAEEKGMLARKCSPEYLVGGRNNQKICIARGEAGIKVHSEIFKIFFGRGADDKDLLQQDVPATMSRAGKKEGFPGLQGDTVTKRLSNLQRSTFRISRQCWWQGCLTKFLLTRALWVAAFRRRGRFTGALPPGGPFALFVERLWLARLCHCHQKSQVR